MRVRRCAANACAANVRMAGNSWIDIRWTYFVILLHLNTFHLAFLNIGEQNCSDWSHYSAATITDDNC